MKVYALRIKDKKELNNSSSGGAFTAISDVFLSSGNAVVSAIYNYDTKQNEFVLYTTLEERNRDFYSPEGNSLVLVHTDKGQRLFEMIKDKVEWRESNTTDCLQPNLINPTERSPRREEFWFDYRKKGISFVIKKYTGVSFMSRIKRKIKKILGGYTSTCPSLWRVAIC